MKWLAVFVVALGGCEVLFPLTHDAAPEEPTATLAVKSSLTLAAVQTQVHLTVLGNPGSVVYFRISVDQGTLTGGVGSLPINVDGLGELDLDWVPPDDYINATFSLTSSYDPDLTAARDAMQVIPVYRQFGHLSQIGTAPLTKLRLVAFPIVITPNRGQVVSVGVQVTGTQIMGQLALYSDVLGAPKVLEMQTDAFLLPPTMEIVECPLVLDVTPGTHWVSFLAEKDVTMGAAVGNDGTIEAAIGMFQFPPTFPTGTPGRTYALHATVGPPP